MYIYLIFSEFPVIFQPECGSNFPFPHYFYSAAIFERILALKVNDEKTKNLRERERVGKWTREEKTVILRANKYNN